MRHHRCGCCDRILSVIEIAVRWVTPGGATRRFCVRCARLLALPYTG